MRNNISKRAAILLLLALISFHLISSYFVLTPNQAFSYCDSAFYLLQSFKRFDSLSHGRFLEAYHSPPTWSYPILYQLLSFPFYLILDARIAPVMTNSIFLVILVLSVYGIGTKLHSRGAGLLASFIVASIPAVFSFFRAYLYDFPLLATIALAIFCLLKTEGFRNRRGALYFGLATGLSALIKPYFFIFLAGPFFVYFFQATRKRGASKKAVLANVAIAFLIAFFVGICGYLPPHLDPFLLLPQGVLAKWADYSLFSYDNISRYPISLVTSLLFPFYSLLFLLSFMLFRNERGKAIFLFSWLFVPLCFFTFVMLNQNDFRFLLPCMPAIALLLALSTFKIRSPLARKAMITIILFLGISQIVTVSFFPSTGIIKVINPFYKSTPESYPSWGLGLPFAYQSDWGISEIKEDIINYISPGIKRINIMEFYGFYASPLVYIFPEEYGIDLEYYARDKRGIIKSEGDIFGMDFVIVPSSNQEEDSDSKEILKAMDSTKEIRKIGIIDLPYNHRLNLYHIDNKTRPPLSTSACNDCSISMKENTQDEILEISYQIPHKKRQLSIWLHNIYERITNYPKDHGWVKITKNVLGEDWENYSTINFMVKGTEADQGAFNIDLIEQDGDIWHFQTELKASSEDWERIEIPFDLFTKAERTAEGIHIRPGDGIKQTTPLQKIQVTFTSFEKESKGSVSFKLFKDEIFYLK
jgi:hypothetical protein